jgi:hypothetical protein
MAPIAHAADGGGSSRVPASCNGLVGLKATRGRVTNGTIEVEGLATHGVVARSVADAATALDVLAHHDPAAWWSPPSPSACFADAVTARPPTGLRIGVLSETPVDGVSVPEPAAAQAVPSDAGTKKRPPVELTRRYRTANPQPGRRRCARCEQTKPVDQFPIRDRAAGTRRSYCTPCWTIRQKERYVSVERERLLAASASR